MTDQNETDEWGIDRRTVLKGVGTVSAAGLMGVSATGTAAADEHCGPGCEPQCEAEVPLCAAQNIEVGTVYVRRVPGEKQIEVEYVLDGDTENDWYLRETHLYVGKTDPTELSSAPGQFPFTKEDYGDGVTSYTYTIDFNEVCEYEIGGGGKGKGGGGKWEEVDGSCGVEEEDCVWIAAHAVVDEVLKEAPYFAADATYEANQGVKKNGDPVDADRSDPEDGLVKAYPDGDFFSLGFMQDDEGGFEDEGGWIEVSFDCPVVNGDGDDLRLWEVTFAPYPEESADVYAKDDGGWRLLGTADNSGQDEEGSPEAHTLSTFDLGAPADGGEAIESTEKIRIVDTTDPGPHNENADGFDLDGIEVLQDCTEDETAWGDGCDGCEITDGGNWATYFEYGIGSDCGEETLPECPFYGTSRSDPTAIFSIRYNSETGEIEETQVGDIPDDFTNSNYPNGLGFDDGDDVWYFAEKNGVLKTMNEDGSLGIETYGVITPGGESVAGAAFHDGLYYYIPNGTDELWTADISGGSASTTKFADLNWSGIGLGDLVVDEDNVLYVSTVSSNAGSIFFSIDLDDTTSQTLISDGDSGTFATGKQLAFEGDTLWAHVAGGGNWYTVDLTDGSLSDLVATTEEYTDLASCGEAEWEVQE